LRFVLDVNVLISGLLSRDGTPARLLEHWLEGHFELVVSERLLEELARTLREPKLSKRISEDEAAQFVTLLSELAEVAADPAGAPPARSADPDDDYLIALAAAERARLVSGDSHLLALTETIPVLAPRAALDLLG